MNTFVYRYFGLPILKTTQMQSVYLSIIFHQFLISTFLLIHVNLIVAGENVRRGCRCISSHGPNEHPTNDGLVSDTKHKCRGIEQSFRVSRSQYCLSFHRQ